MILSQQNHLPPHICHAFSLMNKSEVIPVVGAIDAGKSTLLRQFAMGETARNVLALYQSCPHKQQENPSISFTNDPKLPEDGIYIRCILERLDLQQVYPTKVRLDFLANFLFQGVEFWRKECQHSETLLQSQWESICIKARKKIPIHSLEGENRNVLSSLFLDDDVMSSLAKAMTQFHMRELYGLYEEIQGDIFLQSGSLQEKIGALSSLLADIQRQEPNPKAPSFESLYHGLKQSDTVIEGTLRSRMSLDYGLLLNHIGACSKQTQLQLERQEQWKVGQKKEGFFLWFSAQEVEEYAQLLEHLFQVHPRMKIHVNIQCSFLCRGKESLFAKAKEHHKVASFQNQDIYALRFREISGFFGEDGVSLAEEGLRLGETLRKHSGQAVLFVQSAKMNAISQKSKVLLADYVRETKQKKDLFVVWSQCDLVTQQQNHGESLPSFHPVSGGNIQEILENDMDKLKQSHIYGSLTFHHSSFGFEQGKFTSGVCETIADCLFQCDSKGKFKVHPHIDTMLSDLESSHYLKFVQTDKKFDATLLRHHVKRAMRDIGFADKATKGNCFQAMKEGRIYFPEKGLPYPMDSVFLREIGKIIPDLWETKGENYSIAEFLMKLEPDLSQEEKNAEYRRFEEAFFYDYVKPVFFEKLVIAMADYLPKMTKNKLFDAEPLWKILYMTEKECFPEKKGTLSHVMKLLYSFVLCMALVEFLEERCYGEG